MRVLRGLVLTAGVSLGGLGFASGLVADKLVCESYSSRFQKRLDGICVCSEATRCDTVSNDYLRLSPTQVGVYTTSKAGERLTYTQQDATASDVIDADFYIEPNTTFQSIIGFGGAFTDAAAINVYRLTPTLQQKVLDAYYSQEGLEYSLGRIPIASSDFSESVYSYNPVVDDFEMQHFSIEVDRSPQSHKLELIHRALATSKRPLSIFASPWAPPTWMTRENRTEDSHLKGSPGGKYWKALALYYGKFLEAYEAEGVKIWGITVQNEPVKPPLQLKHWQSLRLSPEEERDFIKKDLGPLLRSRFPNLKIIAHDDQKPDLLDRLTVFDDPEARKFIDGVGIHWYKNLDFFFFGLGGDYDKLNTFHNKHPELFVLATEACEGSMPSWLGTGRGTAIEDANKAWQRGENYARDIINDLANGASGWTDWNLVLDTQGGPNWAGNVVDAPIIVDEKSGTEFYKNPMYYALGHLAKFVPKDSVMIGLRAGQAKVWNDVDRVAFRTPEGRVVVVLCNRRSKAVTMRLQLQPTRTTTTITLPAHSMQTVVFPFVAK